MTLPTHIDATDLLKDAVEKARIAFVPGAAFYPDRTGQNTLRLSFSLNEPEKIAEGIRRLAQLIDSYSESLPRPELRQAHA
jgi:DNA-binding transcriptional MocR family regulator